MAVEANDDTILAKRPKHSFILVPPLVTTSFAYALSAPVPQLAGVSELSALSGAVIKSLAWKSWHMYLSSIIAIFGKLVIPIMRSMIAKFVPAEDVGKVFSLVSLLEMLSALAGPAMYALIYLNYLPPIYPSPVYIFASVSVILSFVCLVFIDLRIKKWEKRASNVAAPQQDSKS